MERDRLARMSGNARIDAASVIPSPSSGENKIAETITRRACTGGGVAMRLY